MRIEDQVCTVQQAERLKELGVVQKSLFYYVPMHEKIMHGDIMIHHTGKKVPVNECAIAISMFTASELVQMAGNVHNIDFSDRENKFYSEINSSATDYKDRFVYYETFTQACADRVIRGLERGYITIDEANARLQISDVPLANKLRIDELNERQNNREVHPLTCCGGNGEPDCKRNKAYAARCNGQKVPYDSENEGVLIATETGWVCPCGKYKQQFQCLK